MTDRNNFDVIIIGGSYAGLSAAMALRRSLRNVLIIDSGEPCNSQTPHSHNFITQDGEKPAAIAEKAKAQVSKYDTVKFHHLGNSKQGHLDHFLQKHSFILSYAGLLLALGRRKAFITEYSSKMQYAYCYSSVIRLYSSKG